MNVTDNAAATGDSSFEFSEESRKRAADIVAKYPDGRQESAVLPLLDLAQRQHGGWLSREVMDYIADYLKMPPIRVYEVATFYTMFNLRPVGRHHVQVCTNLPCWLRGSDEIIGACKQRLSISPGQTSADGQFTLSEAECLGACVNAPMMQIGDDYYEDLTADTADGILDQLQKGQTPKRGSQIGRHSCEPIGGLTTLTTLEHTSERKPADTKAASATQGRSAKKGDA